MKFPVILFTLGVLAIVTSCNSGQKTPQKGDSTLISQKPVLQDSVRNGIYNGYVSLKDALVKSDSIAVGSAAKALVTALNQLEGCEPAAKLTEKIAGTSGLAGQRALFVTLNQELIPLIKQAAISSGKVFVQYCPMANNSLGASWLASEEEIRNPYYGDEMLSCGEVRDTIK